MNIKNTNGITLVSLVIYVVIMLMLIAIIAVFKNNIDKNLDSIGEYTSLVPIIDEVHMYMLGEVNIENNKVLKRNSSGSYIEFSSGNTYMFSDGSLYKNSVKILSDIRGGAFQIGTENNNDVLYVNLNLGDELQNKQLKYVMNPLRKGGTVEDENKKEPQEIAQIGDFVNYSVVVDGITYDKWRILDFDNNGHMEIVCYNGPRYTLGENGNSAKCKNDYANIVKILNEASLPYKNGKYGYSVRHLGSNPTNPNSFSTIPVNYIRYYSNYDSSTNKPRENLEYLEQNHHEADVKAVQSFSGVNKLSGWSWLASRDVYADSNCGEYYVRHITNLGELNRSYLYYIESSNYEVMYTYYSNISPVVSLDSGIKIDTSLEGDGTETSPWKLTK